MYSYDKVNDKYREECGWVKPMQPCFSFGRCVGDSSLPLFIGQLKGKIVSIIQILIVQMSTSTIYESMHFLLVINGSNGVIKWQLLIKIKIHRDGFQYSLKKRRNILITLTNCSIRNFGCTRNNCDVIGLFDCDENRYNLACISQKIQIEALWISIFGLPCIHTGMNLGALIVQTEDTGSLEKAVGKPGSTSHWRWVMSRFGRNVHHANHLYVHAGISLGCALVNNQWRRFQKDQLHPFYLKLGLDKKFIHLCEFNKCKENKYIEENAKKFEKIAEFINTRKYQNYGCISDWYSLCTIYSIGIDGFHCCLRVCNHTAKNIILFAIDYNDWINKAENSEIRQTNHGPFYPRLSLQQILHHFRVCCEVPFYYDEKNPSRSKVYAGY